MAMAPEEQNGDRFLTMLQRINGLAAVGQKLASLLSSVRKIVPEIERKQEEIERVAKLNPNLDPEKAQEIEDLDRMFRSCISCANVFLTDFGFAAEYGLNEEIKKDIKEELEQGNLDTLESFLNRLVHFLKQPKVQLESFNRSQSDADKIAKGMMTEYKKDHDKATRDVDAAKQQHGKATLVGNVAAATTVVSGIGFAAGLMMMESRPALGLRMTIACGITGCGSFVCEHVAASYSLTAKNNLKRSITDQSNLQKALDNIRELQKSMSDIMKVIDHLATQVKYAHGEASMEEGLRMPNQPGNSADKAAIILKLEKLYASLRYMRQVLREGREKIRRYPDQIPFPPNLD